MRRTTPAGVDLFPPHESVGILTSVSPPRIRSWSLTAAAVATATALLALAASSTAMAVDRIEVQPGPNATVSKMSNADSAGNRYVVGRFTAFNAWGTGAGGVVSGTSGEVDRTFPKVDGTINEVIPDGSGGWWIGGDFTCVGGDAKGDGDCTDAGEYVRRDVAHIGADGAVDATFQNPGIEGNVQGLAYAGGVIFAGGRFSAVTQGGERYTRTNLAAFDSTGTVTAWAPAATGVAHATNQVKDLEVSGSSIVVTGDFLQIGDDARKGMALVAQSGTGALVAGFDAGLNNEGWDAVVAGGKVYVSGRFDRLNTGTVGETLRKGLGAVDATTGAADTTFLPATNGSNLALTTDGTDIWVTGTFSSAGTVDPSTGSLQSGVGRKKVAEFDGTTGAPTAWVPGSNAIDMAGNHPQNIAVGSGSVYLTGGFTMVDGEFRSRAAAFNQTTGALLSWDPNLGGEWSYAIAENAGDVYIGGSFTSMGGTPRRGIAGFAQATGALTDFAPELDNAAHGVGVIGDTVFVSGEFTQVRGTGGTVTSRSKAAAFDLSTGALTSWNPNPGANTWNLAIDAARETVFISGDFSLGAPPGGGAARFGIAAVKGTASCVSSWSSSCIRNWNPDLRTDANANTSGGAMAVSGDVIYFAGRFGSVSGDTDHHRVAKVSITEACLETFTAGACVDSAWTPWDTGRGTIGSVSPDRPGPSTINAQSDRIYIGGFFQWLENPQDSSDRRVRNYAASLDPSTGALQSWDPNLGGVVKGIAVITPNVYFSGSFSSIAGQSRRLLGAVSESTAAVQPWNAGAVGTEIFSLIAANDSLYAGGAFTSINGQPNYNFARIAPTTITVGVSGTGSGTVQAAAQGISCGVATCANQVLAGTSVELTAVPDTGSEFESWTGACSAETTAVCTVEVVSASTVSAVFRTADSSSAPGGSDGGSGSTGSAPASSAAQAATGSTQQSAARRRIAWRLGSARVRSVPRRSRVAVNERIRLAYKGRYTLIYEDAAGKRVRIAKGTRIGSRTLRKVFYAPVVRVKKPTSLKISAVLARPNAKAVTLRVILRHPDGTLEGEDIRLR